MNNPVLLLFLYIIHTNCESENNNKSKKFAHYFRKEVEEIEDTTIGNMDENDDTRSNLVEFLIKNVKEIFADLSEKTETTETTRNESTTPTLLLRPTNQTTVLALTASTNTSLSRSHALMVYEYLSLTTLIDKKSDETETEPYPNTERRELLHLSKDVKYFSYTDEKIPLMHEVGAKGFNIKANTTDSQNKSTDAMRSCIACNSVYLENCNNPKNTLIPSVVCEHEDDLCYSLHTPFGIIDRGCFNLNRNITTYVCSCNLCNYISISEMPPIFSSKQDWVDNVVELSRMRNLRKSVSKDMSCLRCEVNATTKIGDMLDSANCLEGNIGDLPVEECAADEVCLVKAVRTDGYIWRGCSKAPLYNYWWAFCNNDLCNYDTIVSIYDFIREDTHVTTH